MPADARSNVDSYRSVAAASGIAFAALFTAAFALFGTIFGTFADPTDTFIDYYESDAHRATDVVGVYVLSLAGMSFAAFGVMVSQWLKAMSDSVVLSLIAPAGLLAAAGMLVAAGLLGTVSLSLTLGDFFDERSGLDGAEVAVLPQAGTVVLGIAAAMSASALVAAISFSAWGARALPRWICVLGSIAAPLIFMLSLAGPPLLLLPAWVLIASIALARSRLPERS
jgi:hypothetical protein